MNRIFLGALICGGALAFSCHHSSSAATQPQPPAGEAWLSPQQVKNANLKVGPVVDQDVGGAVVTSGKVTFDDLRVSHVFSPVTGRLVKIDAQPGQRVKKGAALATIESPDVGNAFSDLAKAHAEQSAAEHDYKRQKELFDAHAASQKDFEQAQDNWQKAKAELSRAQKKAQLLSRGNADSVTQEYTLRAPIDGEVITRNVTPGMEVVGQYSQGNALELFTIGELDHVWVLADVFEMDLGRIKKGARANVRVVTYPTRMFEGVVDYVSGQLDPNTRTAKVRCTIANPDRDLKPEMYATVSVSVAERKALAIPRSAMLRLGDQTVVFVETGASPNGLIRFERRPVAVDEDEGGDYMPVTHGLERGEKIVTSGAILLAGML
ncbi:MAG: putative Co/Zn/Cd efflux system rane fusion protein [Myxococcales bacterium]|nr:putative Co/Zn/Cd efflux system rane fusion protein [Myxococcales bacterium]